MLVFPKNLTLTYGALIINLLLKTLFQDDQVFTFNFNLIGTREGVEVTYALNQTCSPSLPWAPREFTCEANYMEVSLYLRLFNGLKMNEYF